MNANSPTHSFSFHQSTPTQKARSVAASVIWFIFCTPMLALTYLATIGADNVGGVQGDCISTQSGFGDACASVDNSETMQQIVMVAIVAFAVALAALIFKGLFALCLRKSQRSVSYPLSFSFSVLLLGGLVLAFNLEPSGAGVAALMLAGGAAVVTVASTLSLQFSAER